MNTRAFWLGAAPLVPAAVVDLATLPATLSGDLVVQPTPLQPDEALALFDEVARRGGRLAVELGTEPPASDSYFQFCRQACSESELRRQFESLLADRHLSRPSRASFTLRTFHLVEPVAHAVAALLPKPGVRIVGLVELLLNACEHGNLGVTRAEKQALLADGRWITELERRERTAPWSTREVAVEVVTEGAFTSVTITDEGDGFDHQVALLPGKLHGRGLSIARQLSFDTVEFEGRGNRVVAKVRR